MKTCSVCRTEFGIRLCPNCGAEPALKRRIINQALVKDSYPMVGGFLGASSWNMRSHADSVCLFWFQRQAILLFLMLQRRADERREQRVRLERFGLEFRMELAA